MTHEPSILKEAVEICGLCACQSAVVGFWDVEKPTNAAPPAPWENYFIRCQRLFFFKDAVRGRSGWSLGVPKGVAAPFFRAGSPLPVERPYRNCCWGLPGEEWRLGATSRPEDPDPAALYAAWQELKLTRPKVGVKHDLQVLATVIKTRVRKDGGGWTITGQKGVYYKVRMCWRNK